MGKNFHGNHQHFLPVTFPFQSVRAHDVLPNTYKIVYTLARRSFTTIDCIVLCSDFHSHLIANEPLSISSLFFLSFFYLYLFISLLHFRALFSNSFFCFILSSISISLFLPFSIAVSARLHTCIIQLLCSFSLSVLLPLAKSLYAFEGFVHPVLHFYVFLAFASKWNFW